MTREPEQEPQKVRIRYEKANAHRVIYATGMWGGLTPDLRNIRMALFNERSRLPDEAVYPITAEGRLGEAPPRTGVPDIIREVEIEAIFSVETARARIPWLQSKIDQVEQLEAERQKRSTE